MTHMSGNMLSGNIKLKEDTLLLYTSESTSIHLAYCVNLRSWRFRRTALRAPS